MLIALAVTVMILGCSRRVWRDARIASWPSITGIAEIHQDETRLPMLELGTASAPVGRQPDVEPDGARSCARKLAVVVDIVGDQQRDHAA